MKIRTTLGITLIICLLAVPLGCGSPVESETPLEKILAYNKLSAAHTDLQNRHNVLLHNYENLKGVREELDTLTNNYRELASIYSAMQVKNVVLEAQFQATNDRYEEIILSLASGQGKFEEALERQVEQYHELIERQALLTWQLDLVNREKAAAITDNLTTTEYKAFLQGWNVWWDSFNE